MPWRIGSRLQRGEHGRGWSEPPSEGAKGANSLRRVSEKLSASQVPGQDVAKLGSSTEEGREICRAV